ncbi:MAG: NADH-quinone oxidoreductase subunit NuoG [Caldilineaceae bacterium SB0661_bin_32]|uniref:NADH-quinone oxidoreductase n=1 Tax=Caldilineaceae bacterium SB0661_bin_32 TaxID=2605255 RepID=A0A6B1D8W4_9CHLR|nr:NADH-quinone oxidoreductase subunit NuoG [Caldilineaceae bacterium SB0661_bin_32]
MTDNVTLTINEEEVSVPARTLLVDAARMAGIEIPVFCSHPKLDPVGCCRMCLVEVDGPRGTAMMASCTMPVGDGMVVRTNTEQVRTVQEANLAFILLNHPLDCPICDKGGECPLQDQTMRFGPGISQLIEPKRLAKKHYDISDTIVLDQERCVLCWRCIRYLEEWEDKPQLGLFERGNDTIVDIQDGRPVDAKTGGNIIDLCPVGALTNRVSRFAYRPWEIERTPSVCMHCSVGCNVRLDSRTHQLRRIVGRENMQVNDQWICDKGRFAHAWVNDGNRLAAPLLRKKGKLTPVQWSEALAYIADRITRIKEKFGADSIGAIGSGKISNESNYALQRFMRAVVGTNNIDHRDGGEVAALPTGLPALAELMKPQYGPDPQVDTVLLFGVDPSEELPILDLHLKRAILRGGVKLIIAHARKIELTRYDGPYLAYVPGGESSLLDRLLQAIQGSTESENESSIQAAATILNESERALIVYGPMAARGEDGPSVRDGLIQLAQAAGEGTRLAYAGLDGNAQGCRDMGVLPDRLPGQFPLDSAGARTRLEALWGCSLSTSPGYTYKQMLDSQEMRALIVNGANPAAESPDWSARLEELELLVVTDLLPTETAQKADVVLPALGWAESDGTYTNLERRVQRAPKAVSDPKSRAAPDWMMLTHLARQMGANWPFSDARSVTAEIARAVPAYAGLTWEALGDQGLQWDADSAPATESSGGRTSEGLPDSAADNAEFPLNLVTGTVLYDGGTLFSLTDQMHGMAHGATVTLNPVDAAEFGLDPGSAVTVQSEQGHLDLTVGIDVQVQTGTAWIPESLPGAPVGALLNGSHTQRVKVEKR